MARRGARRGSAGSAATRPRTGGRRSASQTPVASTTAVVRISKSAPVVMSSGQDRLDRARRGPRAKAGRAHPGDGHAAGGDRRASHRERVPGVVLDPVVVQQAAAQPLGPQRRGELEGRALRQSPVPAAVVPRAEDVVERQARVVERLRGERDAVDREQQGLQADEMRREVGAAAIARRAPRGPARSGTARGSGGRRG